MIKEYDKAVSKNQPKQFTQTGLGQSSPNENPYQFNPYKPVWISHQGGATSTHTICVALMISTLESCRAFHWSYLIQCVSSFLFQSPKGHLYFLSSLAHPLLFYNFKQKEHEKRIQPDKRLQNQVKLTTS